MVNLVGRILLGEGLDTDLGDSDTDKRNPNGIIRCQSMMVNEDQHWGNWTKIREISSVPGDSSCSQWVEQSAREVRVEQQDLETSNEGLAYKKETFRERRKKINSRVIRKYNIEAIQWPLQYVVRCTSRIQSVIGR